MVELACFESEGSRNKCPKLLMRAQPCLEALV